MARSVRPPSRPRTASRVAAVQALEAILAHAVRGEPDCVVRVNGSDGGLVLYRPGSGEPEVLYAPKV